MSVHPFQLSNIGSIAACMCFMRLQRTVILKVLHCVKSALVYEYTYCHILNSLTRDIFNWMLHKYLELFNWRLSGVSLCNGAGRSTLLLYSCFLIQYTSQYLRLVGLTMSQEVYYMKLISLSLSLISRLQNGERKRLRPPYK
jgi:hypothetical protein